MKLQFCLSPMRGFPGLYIVDTETGDVLLTGFWPLSKDEHLAVVDAIKTQAPTMEVVEEFPPATSDRIRRCFSHDPSTEAETFDLQAASLARCGAGPPHCGPAPSLLIGE